MSKSSSQIYIPKVESPLFERLKLFTEDQSYPFQADLYYEGQVPIVAYLLVKGEMLLTKKQNIVTSIPRGSFVGLKELIKGIPSEYGLRVLPGSLVSFLYKTTAFEILQSEPSTDIKDLLNQIML